MKRGLLEREVLGLDHWLLIIAKVLAARRERRLAKATSKKRG